MTRIQPCGSCFEARHGHGTNVMVMAPMADQRQREEKVRRNKERSRKQESKLQQVWEVHRGNEALGCRVLQPPLARGDAPKDTNRHQKKRQSCLIMRLWASPVWSGPGGGRESGSALSAPPRLLPRVFYCAVILSITNTHTQIGTETKRERTRRT